MRSLKAAAIAGIVASAATGMVVATGTTAKSKHGHHQAHSGKARNVIFIQGDGMGIAHRELIRLATKGQNGELAMNKLQYAGLVHTDPADPDEPVTDSAAAATAYSTGVKSYNGAIGVDVNGKPVTTLLEQARAAGRSTGLVTTSQVTDATPAAFGAHVQDRSDQSEIARQFIESTKPDVILGGGEDFWFPAGTEGGWPDHPAKDPTEASKGTKGNLVDRAQQLGYKYVKNAQEMQAAGSGKLLGLFANEEMFEHRNEGQGDLYDPSVPLKDMASKALDTLHRDRDGFFLLVEEEGIDEMAHHSNAKLTIKSGAALDDTVAMVMRFAAKTPGTLVLVVGDHETGGLAIENVDETDESGAGETAEDGPIPVANSNLKMSVDWTTGQHTGGATPITAQGPGAERLGRVQQNTDVHDSIARAMGFTGKKKAGKKSKHR
jgi:alkaline phosphatase